MSDIPTRDNKPPLFGEFLVFLRRQGFAIGVDHYSRIYELAEKLEGNCNPDELKTTLCPIFATSKFQQQEFYQAFDAFFGHFKSPVSERAIGVGAATEKKPALGKRLLAEKRTTIRILSVLALFAIALTLLLIYFQIAGKPIEQVFRVSPELGFFERNLVWILMSTSLLLFTLYLIYEWYRSKRTLVLQERTVQDPLFTWSIKIDSYIPITYNAEEFLAVCRFLRRREVGDYRYLDIPATISATIGAADYPILRYKPNTRPPEYLALIERTSLRDHQAKLFDNLLRLLEEEGVYIRRYFYDADPRICYSYTGKESASLEKLQSRFPAHRLLVFSTGEKLFDAVTGRLQNWSTVFSNWNLRILLTPHPVVQWGVREVMLGRHFFVLPATIKGLLSLADSFESGVRPDLTRWSQDAGETPPDIYYPSEMVITLRRYLGEEVFEWLCACACYPELQWDLTLYLGSLPCMGKNLLAEAILLKLTGLPWFHEGSIPKIYRDILVRELDSKKKEDVHRAIFDLLKKDLPPQYSDGVEQGQLQVEVGWPAPDIDQRERQAEALRKGRRASAVQTVLIGVKNLLRSPLDIPIPAYLFKRLKAYAVSDVRDRSAAKLDISGRKMAARPAYSHESHPTGLYVLFATEIWERFSFYSMLALFTLYMQDEDGFSWTPAQATSLYSNYLMFVYASPLFGGWLADKILGYRRAVVIGGFFFIAGYGLLSVPSLWAVYSALTCLVIGNGFFKPNVSTMVGNLYPEGSHLKDRAYSIFYMGINIGAFLAPVVMEVIKTRWGVRLAFEVAAFGMVISASILWLFKHRVEDLAVIEGKGAGKALPTVGRGAEIENISDAKRIGALIVVFLIIIVFWMVFHQNGSTLTYWADDNTDWDVSGTISNAINPFWVVTLTFPLVWFWKWLDQKGLEPSTTTKIAIGMILTGISFFILYLAARVGEASVIGSNAYDYRVSPVWLFGAYGVISLAELMLSPLGLSLVSKVAPIRLRGLMMGGWFAATAIGNKLTAIGVYWDVWLHSTFFAVLGSLAILIGIVYLLLLKPLKKAMPGV